jgi:hypothetical protein
LRWNACFAEFPGVFDWREPDGGCGAFIRYNGDDSVEKFTRRVVEEAGVFFLPSSVYRSDLTPVPENGLHLGFGRRKALAT